MARRSASDDMSRSRNGLALPRRSSTAPLRPIRSEAAYREALRDIDALEGAAPGTAGFDRLEVMRALVAAYERSHHALDALTPIDAIELRMEQLGWTRKNLEGILGSRARVSEVLNGRRGLSLEMIRKVHLRMNIPAEVLIGPLRRRRARRARRR